MVERPGKSGGWILVILLAAVLAVWVCWPLTSHLSSGIPYTFSAPPEGRMAGLVHGDHLQYLYHLHLLREAVDGRIRPFSNPYEFAGPYHRDEPYVYFPFAYVFLPFSYGSDALGYNALVFLSFLGTMVAGYGLARAWGASRGGALCAGIVLTLFPNRLNSLFGGHAAGETFFLFPMAWWGLEKNWQTGRYRWGWMAALSLMVMSIQDVHYLFFFCLLLPFWALWKLLEQKAIRFPERTRDEPFRVSSVVTWQAVTAILLLTATYVFNLTRIRAASPLSPPLLGLLVFFSLAVLGVNSLTDVLLKWLGLRERRFRERWLAWPWASFWLLLGYFAANYVNRPGFGSKLVVGSLLLFGGLHLGFLFRAVQKRALSPGAIRIPWKRVLTLWPSAVGLGIALLYPLYLKLVVFSRSTVAQGRTAHEVSLFSVPFRDLFTRSPEGGAYVGWGLVGMVAAGAVAFFLAERRKTASERRVRLAISIALTALGMILACGLLLGNVFPLYGVLLRLIPFLNYIRATGKFLILMATAGSLALALLVTDMEDRLGGKVVRKWLAPCVGLLLILDWAPISKVGVSVLPDESTVYEVVAKEGKGTRLLELPIWPGDSAFSSAYQYGTMLTGVPTINGYSPLVPAGYKENIADPLYSLNFGVLRGKEFTLLKDLDVRFITFQQGFFPRQVSALPATHSLKRLLLNLNLELSAREGDAYLFRRTQDYVDVTGTPCDEEASVGYFVPNDLLNHQVGEEVTDADAMTGTAWKSGRQNGFLFFGPFLMLPPGEYVAMFRLKVDGPKDLTDIGYLDVYTGEGTEQATKHVLPPSDWPTPSQYRFVEIPFTVDRPHPVQTRGVIEEAKRATIWLDFVFIKSARLGDAIRLEAEDFFSTIGRVALVEEATQGICLATAGRTPSGEAVLEEAFVFLKAGRYEVRCSTKGRQGKVAELRVRRIGKESSVNRFDVRGGGEVNRFVVNEGVLDVAADAAYGVSLWSTGKGLRAVDYISFSPASDN